MSRWSEFNYLSYNGSTRSGVLVIPSLSPYQTISVLISATALGTVHKLRKITDRGEGSPQKITILHRGGLAKRLQYYMGGGVLKENVDGAF